MASIAVETTREGTDSVVPFTHLINALSNNVIKGRYCFVSRSLGGLLGCYGCRL